MHNYNFINCRIAALLRVPIDASISCVNCIVNYPETQYTGSSFRFTNCIVSRGNWGGQDFFFCTDLRIFQEHLGLLRGMRLGLLGLLTGMLDDSRGLGFSLLDGAVADAVGFVLRLLPVVFGLAAVASRFAHGLEDDQEEQREDPAHYQPLLHSRNRFLGDHSIGKTQYIE